MRASVFVPNYPVFSETFIARESLGLIDEGFDIEIVSRREPGPNEASSVREAIDVSVRHLSFVGVGGIARLVRACYRTRTSPHYPEALRLFGQNRRSVGMVRALAGLRNKLAPVRSVATCNSQGHRILTDIAAGHTPVHRLLRGLQVQ